MNQNNLVYLASCAAKSTEEAKKAEAHARACRVYAKKLSKRSTEAREIAVHLICYANSLLRDYLDGEGARLTVEDLEELIASAPRADDDVAVHAAVLKAILEFDCPDVRTSNREKMREKFCMNDALLLDNKQMTSVQNSLSDYAKTNIDALSNSCNFLVPAPPRPLVDNCGTPGRIQSFHPQLQSLSPYCHNKLEQTEGAGLGAGQQKRQRVTRRRSSFNRTSGIPSPLLSQEEITFVQMRATSPNPSQHSGNSPKLAKFAVRRKRSGTSQHTTDDDDVIMMVMPSRQQQQQQPEATLPVPLERG